MNNIATQQNNLSAKYQVMPDLTPEEYAALKADIAEYGVLVAIEFDENGNVLDGHHRLRVCEELEITEYPKIIKAGMSEEEKLAYATRINVMRRHLTNEQKRQLIRDQLVKDPGKSDRQIAIQTGTSHPFVGDIRKEMEQSGDVETVSTSTDTLERQVSYHSSGKKALGTITKRLRLLSASWEAAIGAR